MSNKELLHNFSTTEYTESTERSCFSLCPLCTLWFFTYQKRIKSLLNGLTDSPQSTQRTQSLAMPVTPYEKAAASRFRTRMTRIARIFADPCALLKVHFLEFIRLERNSKILETLNTLYITSRLFNRVRLKKLAVE